MPMVEFVIHEFSINLHNLGADYEYVPDMAGI